MSSDLSVGERAVKTALRDIQESPYVLRQVTAIAGPQIQLGAFYRFFICIAGN
ncbi:hypothetical protein [Cylindrospermum stagnale]|uniref:hypothetical protein n=1 Tax=Cylindrospermum stagnale TaxID=142864 RepID=UPI0002FE12AC|nr:hypothetical protein [Cylindrospermum stagnale]